MADSVNLVFTPTKPVPNQVNDVFLSFGEDLRLSSTGDLLLVYGEERGKQRILRRLLTNPKDYVWHVSYGAGIPEKIGRELSPELYDEIRSLILSQIFIEQAVSNNPPPDILLQQIQQGLYCQINYTDSQTSNQIIITFNVSA